MYTEGLQTFNVFHLNWLEQFLPWHPKPPTTKIFEDASNNFSVDKFKANMRFCVSVFMHVCVGATIFKSSATTSWFDSAETHIREQRCSNPWIFPGPARRDQEFTERSKRTKGQQPKNVESKPGNPWTKRKKNHWNFGKSLSSPIPIPPKKLNLELITAPPQTDTRYVALMLIQETRMDPPNLGRLVSLLVVGLNQPIFNQKKYAQVKMGDSSSLKFSEDEHTKCM